MTKTEQTEKSKAEIPEDLKNLKLDHLFKRRPKVYNAANRPPKKNLYRVVKWPKYIAVQRKKSVLKKRLKIPPPVFQFSNTLNKNLRKNLVELANKYKPETPAEKKIRLKELAEKQLKNEPLDSSTKPYFLKFGLCHVTQLIERRKAKLVVIAADVEPIEMVLFMPTLCRKMDIPYCIVKSKSFLGSLVNQKKVTCIAFTEVRKGKDESALSALAASVYEEYNKTSFKKWGGGELGIKAQMKLAKSKKLNAKSA